MKKSQIFLIASAVFLVTFGLGLYYFVNYAHYQYEEHKNYVLNLKTGERNLENVVMIDATTSPLKLRICADALDLSDFEKSEDATPLVAPSWFGCFDGKSLAQKLERGEVEAYKLESNEPYGFDLYVINDENTAHIWRQLNACGEAFFQGENLPDGCPEKESE